MARAGEQALDHLLVGIRGRVGQERVQLIRCRRQTDQVEIHPPQERGPVGGRRGGEPLLFVDDGNEGVDGIAHPGGALDGRRDRPLGPLKGPVAARIVFRPLRDRAASALLDPPV